MTSSDSMSGDIYGDGAGIVTTGCMPISSLQGQARLLLNQEGSYFIIADRDMGRSREIILSNAHFYH